MARKANNFPFDIEVVKGNYYIKFKEEIKNNYENFKNIFPN